MSRLIDADKLLAMTDSYKKELGRLKADPFVKSGIETVEGFINDLPKVKSIPLDKVKQAREELDKLPIYGAKFTDDFRIHFDREEVFSILDKLIAESEEK